MRICAISDTHGHHRKLQIPECDVLIHAGDITNNGEWQIMEDFALWMKEQAIKHKIVIFGNHETEHDISSYVRYMTMNYLKEANITVLGDSEIVLDGVKFYGSSWQHQFAGYAFHLPWRSTALIEKWKQIPIDTNVLITHTPPYGILDLVPQKAVVPFIRPGTEDDLVRVGDQDLLARVARLPKLKAHVFGHIHYSHGERMKTGIQFVNAAICTEDGEPNNKPIVIEIKINE